MKKIEEIATGIDDHLRKLESFTGILREVKIALDMLRENQEKIYLHELNKVKKDINSLTESLQKFGLPKTSEYEKELAEIREFIEGEEHPLAVEADLICDTDEKTAIRAGVILDLFVAENLKGKKFLDYGCGFGHTILAAEEREAALSIGYDIDMNNFQSDKKGVTYHFDVVKSNAPYDIILIHDVLDHIVVIDPIEALKQAASVLSPEGRIYLRTHPWSSRHGNHLYKSKNKAFLHLLLDEVELMRCFGIESEHNIKITNPIDTYRDWIKKANLNITSELITKTNVESCFTKPSVIREKIAKTLGQSENIENILEIDFVEYILELPKNTNAPIF